MQTLKEFKELHKMVDQIFAEAFRQDLSWEELATKAAVCFKTVDRLGRFETMWPRAQTILLLARAVGLKMKLEKAKLRLRVIA